MPPRLFFTGPFCPTCPPTKRHGVAPRAAFRRSGSHLRCLHPIATHIDPKLAGAAGFGEGLYEREVTPTFMTEAEYDTGWRAAMDTILCDWT